jgi:hypothetical protein
MLGLEMAEHRLELGVASLYTGNNGAKLKAPILDHSHCAGASADCERLGEEGE